MGLSLMVFSEGSWPSLEPLNVVNRGSAGRATALPAIPGAGCKMSTVIDRMGECPYPQPRCWGWNPGLTHSKQEFYHEATSPGPQKYLKDGETEAQVKSDVSELLT